MPFSNPAEYSEDIEIFCEKIKNKEKFAFSKYADGELHIFANRPVNNGEFWFRPGTDEFYRQEMLESIKHKDPGYYIGISCPCCIGGVSAHNYMINLSGQEQSHMTWANLFVNGNYDYYLENVVPLYKEYDVYLISNDASNLSNLPFDVKKHFKIGKNAWVSNSSLKNELVEYINTKNVKNSLFLFCAGPFGNILVSNCWKNDKNNTYIDIGSTLNPLLLGESGKNRGYLREGSTTRGFSCTWGNT